MKVKEILAELQAIQRQRTVVEKSNLSPQMKANLLDELRKQESALEARGFAQDLPGVSPAPASAGKK